MTSSKSNGSVISAVTEITGNVSGEGNLRVDGKINGSVNVTGEVLISDGASIRGPVSGAEVSLDGALDGDIDSAGPVRIGAQATYRGTLRGERVTITPGAAVAAHLDTPFDLKLDI